LPLKGRLILAFLRALVEALKADRVFVPRPLISAEVWASAGTSFAFTPPVTDSRVAL
jgi:hypothetical protein